MERTPGWERKREREERDSRVVKGEQQDLIRFVDLRKETILKLLFIYFIIKIPVTKGCVKSKLVPS